MATFASHTGFDLPRDSAEDSFDFLPYLKGEEAEPPRACLNEPPACPHPAIPIPRIASPRPPPGCDRSSGVLTVPTENQKIRI